MPTITQREFYDGAKQRIERLGLDSLLGGTEGDSDGLSHQHGTKKGPVYVQDYGTYDL